MSGCTHDGGVCPDCGGSTLTVESFVDTVMAVLSESPERLIGALSVVLVQTAVLAASAPHGAVPGETDVTVAEIMHMNRALAEVSEGIHLRLIGLVPEAKEREIRSALAEGIGLT